MGSREYVHQALHHLDPDHSIFKPGQVWVWVRFRVRVRVSDRETRVRVKARGEREGSGLGIPNSYPIPIPQPGAQREGVEGIPREQLGAKPGRGRLVGTLR